MKNDWSEKVKKVIVFIIMMLSLYFLNLDVEAHNNEEPSEQLLDFMCGSDNFLMGHDYKSINDFMVENPNTILGMNSKMQRVGGPYSIYADDPIINVIPKYYFVNEGTKLYLGRDYGFFIKTEREEYCDFVHNIKNYTDNFRNKIIIFDFDYSMNGIDRINNGVKFLYSYQFITVNKNSEKIYRKLSYDDIDASIADEKYSDPVYVDISPYTELDYLVAPLYDCYLNLNYKNLYASNLKFAATLRNKQNLNSFDTGYDPMKDPGAFITETNLYYNAIYYNSISPSWREFNKALMTIALEQLVGSIPYAGDLLTILDTMQEMKENLISIPYNENDVSANEAPSKLKYVTVGDQLAKYKKLTKSDAIRLKNLPKYMILLGKGNNASAKFTINYNEIVNTDINLEIGLDIVDVSGNVICSGHKNDRRNLRTEEAPKLSLGENSIYTLDKNISIYEFSIDDSALIDFKFNLLKSSRVSIICDDKEVLTKKLIADDEKVSVVLEGGKLYKIKIENDTNVTIIGNMILEISDNLNFELQDTYLIRVNPHLFKQIYAIDNSTGRICKFIDLEVLGEDKFKDPSYKSEIIFHLSDKDYIIKITNRNTGIKKLTLVFVDMPIASLHSGSFLVKTSNKYFSFKSSGLKRIVFDNSAYNFELYLYTDTTKISLRDYLIGTNEIIYNFDSRIVYHLGLEGINHKDDFQDSKELKKILYTVEDYVV